MSPLSPSHFQSFHFSPEPVTTSGFAGVTLVFTEEVAVPSRLCRHPEASKGEAGIPPGSGTFSHSPELIPGCQGLKGPIPVSGQR